VCFLEVFVATTDFYLGRSQVLLESLGFNLAASSSTREKEGDSDFSLEGASPQVLFNLDLLQVVESRLNDLRLL